MSLIGLVVVFALQQAPVEPVTEARVDAGVSPGSPEADHPAVTVGDAGVVLPAPVPAARHTMVAAPDAPPPRLDHVLRGGSPLSRKRAP